MISPAAAAELSTQSRQQNVCSACSTPLQVSMTQGKSVRISYCDGCGGLDVQGLDQEASYLVVSGRLTHSTPEMEARQIYFNFEGPGYRRHGWYDPKTGSLLQVG